MATRASAKSPRVVTPPPAPVGEIDTRYLETLIGYNARRAALSVIGLFLTAHGGVRAADRSIFRCCR